MMRRLALPIMILLFLALVVWGMYTYVTLPHPGANDFAQRWHGSHAFWVEGKDPYSREVALDAELMLYGAPASTDPALDQYPGDFLYPFHYAVILAPLAPLSYALASAIWMTLTATMCGLCFVLMAQTYGWRLSPLMLTLGVAWAVSFYPSARGVILGQPGTFVVCLQIVALWALAKDRDVLAGVLLAVSTYKPQIGIFILPFLLLWGLRVGRRRFVIVFIVSFAALMLASFLLLPAWLGEWLQQTAQYTGYTRIGSPVWVIAHVYLPFLGTAGEIVITALLVLFMLWAWWRVIWRREHNLFDWTAALSLAVTHLVALRTATPHFVAYLPVLVFSFRELARSDRRTGTGRVLIAMLALNVALWVLFLTTVEGRFESPLCYLPIPWGSLILLWLMRNRWWNARPSVKLQGAAA
ncbi:MAG: DUF2029 domain-containing protein [Anaerolineae bacterium]|nr:DUF2029 domain-containing protein [Anaerolineae bacterium]